MRLVWVRKAHWFCVDLEAETQCDWDESGCAEAVGLADRWRVDKEVTRFGEDLGLAVAVESAEAMGDAEADADQS
jgi:hypothetical protein